MPRRGENIYKRKDGRWEGRVLKPDGKYQYVYSRTYREVKEKKKMLQERIAFVSSQRQSSAGSATEAFENWLNGDLFKRVKPSTYESYYRSTKKYVIPYFQRNGGNCFTEQTVTEFTKQIIEDKTLSGSYKRKILSIFKTSLREILKGSYDSVLGGISLPKCVNSNIPVFSVKEQTLIEKNLIRSRDQASIGMLLCLYTGIRLGEICALKWGDIDFDAATMSITRTVSRVKNFTEGGNKTVLSVGVPKSQKSIRKIPLPDFLLELLLECKSETKEDDYYILSNSLYPIDPRSFQKSFQKTLQASGVKRRKFHAIRHTFATRALELGVDIKTLSEILGHANVSITLNIYAHSMFEQKKKAIDQLNAMYVLHAESNSYAVNRTVVVG